MMFALPPEQSLEWSDEGVKRQNRFLRRLWRAVYEHAQPGETIAPLEPQSLSAGARELRHVAHQTLAKVTADIGPPTNFGPPLRRSWSC